MKQRISSKQQNQFINMLKDHLSEKGYRIKVLKSTYEIGHHTILIIKDIFICCWFKISIKEEDYIAGMMKCSIFDGAPIDSISSFRTTYDMINEFTIL